MSFFGDTKVALLRDENGATAVEYAMMLVLIILVCIAVIAILGNQVDDSFNKFVTDFDSAKNS